MNLKTRTSTVLLSLSFAITSFAPFETRAATGQADLHLRPPAVPLVACDPYFSIWSQGDKLTDVDTTHWTGKPHRLTSLIRIDGKPFRVIGKEPAGVPALPQTNLEVLPTRTVYTLEGQGIRLNLTFTTPALPDDIDVLARPVTYLTWDLKSTDSTTHTVSLDFDANAEITVNSRDQQTTSSTNTEGDWVITRTGSVEQPVLQRKGDDVRIDWGYLYLARPRDFASDVTVSSKPVSRWLMLAYDDEFSIQYRKSVV